MGTIQQFFEGLGKATDILNLGRLIFYTASGACVVMPAYLIMTLLIDGKTAETVWASQYWTGGVMLVVSMIVGFLIAASAFPLVLDNLGDRLRAEMKVDLDPSDTVDYSFPRNYPLLKGKGGGEDYAAWLISEYYRYVEIVTYIPLGAIAGLVLLTVYVAISLIQHAGPGGSGVTGRHVSLIGLAAGLVVIRYWLWPEVWVKRVIGPTIRVYFSAKRGLIQGVRAVGGAPPPGAPGQRA